MERVLPGAHRVDGPPIQVHPEALRPGAVRGGGTAGDPLVAATIQRGEDLGSGRELALSHVDVGVLASASVASPDTGALGTAAEAAGCGSDAPLLANRAPTQLVPEASAPVPHAVVVDVGAEPGVAHRVLRGHTVHEPVVAGTAHGGEDTRSAREVAVPHVDVDVHAGATVTAPLVDVGDAAAHTELARAMHATSGAIAAVGGGSGHAASGTHHRRHATAETRTGPLEANVRGAVLVEELHLDVGVTPTKAEPAGAPAGGVQAVVVDHLAPAVPDLDKHLGAVVGPEVEGVRARAPCVHRAEEASAEVVSGAQVAADHLVREVEEGQSAVRREARRGTPRDGCEVARVARSPDLDLPAVAATASDGAVSVSVCLAQALAEARALPVEGEEGPATDAVEIFDADVVPARVEANSTGALPHGMDMVVAHHHAPADKQARAVH
mmetsp:Transcript_16589/g.39004  ORF Transcript_16589/g.39004 Transcript_16589/m.39004 type:complete len:440 (+) Transcript_16589:1333-2652(+)